MEDLYKNLNSPKGLPVFVIFVLIILLVAIAGFFYSRNVSESLTDVTPTTTVRQVDTSPSNLKTVQANWTSAEKNWQVGKVYTVKLNLNGQETYKPNSTTLHVRFDPKVLKFNSAAAGMVWSKAISLRENSQPETGLVKLTFAQDFEAKITNDKNLVSLTFTALDRGNGSTTISLEGESVVAAVGDPALSRVVASPLSVNLVN